MNHLNQMKMLRTSARLIVGLLFLGNIYQCQDAANVETSPELSTQTPTLSSNDEVLKIVEIMPMFPGCQNQAYLLRKSCSQEKMLDYIYTNIKYPTAAREYGVQGQVVIRFIVEKNGDISEATILRDKGAGLGTEALRVVRSMNSMAKKWSPGTQDGKIVRVAYNLPIKFKLE